MDQSVRLNPGCPATPAIRSNYSVATTSGEHSDNTIVSSSSTSSIEFKLLNDPAGSSAWKDRTHQYGHVGGNHLSIVFADDPACPHACAQGWAGTAAEVAETVQG
ncbi:MAG: hypothetical protein J5X22_14860 [Candidatus Accumulibacter sp.]|uniref:hypothetical protein n=1 Tax=Accumulibacter sp. TaxID=2053492 RepID=UPI001ACDFC7C|nr:hypothetical protein [Accumulibacter sp.]MBN8519022.1 hypothetical protein [Accumulibacter sp.]MBO3711722.1 hypothetical protein [Accumulibacter sp.]